MTYLKLYQSLIGPHRETRSPFGLQLVKFHCLTHFPRQYRKFGTNYNYFGDFFESSIKTMAQRNLAITTRKHGRSVEDQLMRYFEQKVCDFSVMVLDKKSKSMERLIPKAKQIPKKRKTALHLILDSGFYVVWDDATEKWCIRRKKLFNCKKLILPLVSSPEENHWLSILTKYVAIEDIKKTALGFKPNIQASTTSTDSDPFQGHPNLYSQGDLVFHWDDFASVRTFC
jgi:hypothetical protein